MLAILDLTNPIYKGCDVLDALVPPYLSQLRDNGATRVVVVKPAKVPFKVPAGVDLVEHNAPLRCDQIPFMMVALGDDVAHYPFTLLSFDSLWIDPIADEISRFQKSAEKACLVYTQPGVQHALIKADGFDIAGGGRAADLEGRLRTMSSLGKAVLRRPPIAGNEYYLCIDYPMAREFLLKVRQRQSPRTEWRGDRDLRTGVVQNHRKLDAFIRKLAMLRRLEGARVLEIGASSSQRAVADILVGEFGVKSYTGMNIDRFEYTLDYPDSKLVTTDIHNFVPDQTYDVIFSFAVWEHILNPLPIVAKIPKWLSIGGVHYGIYFCWTGANGHHITREVPGAQLVSAFDHLRLDETAMRAKLEAGAQDPDVVDEILDRLYHRDYINRVGAKDFLNALLTCGLEVVHLDFRNGGRYHPWVVHNPEGIPGYSNEELSINGFEFMLRRSHFDWRSVLSKEQAVAIAGTQLAKPRRR